MKASRWLKGRRAINTVPLPLAKQADRSGSIGGVGSPPTDAEAPVVGLRALGPIEHEEIMQRAYSDARAAGLEKPTEDDEAYRYYKALHLVHVTCVDPDAPEEPFFDGGLQQLRDSAELGRDGIAWLAEQWEQWQDEVGPYQTSLSQAELEQAVRTLAGEGGDVFFCGLRPGMRWSLARFMAILLLPLLESKSSSGGGSTSNSSSTTAPGS
jgi:hypothetical protein